MLHITCICSTQGDGLGGSGHAELLAQQEEVARRKSEQAFRSLKGQSLNPEFKLSSLRLIQVSRTDPGGADPGGVPFSGVNVATYQFDFTYSFRYPAGLTGLMPGGGVL